MQAASALQIVVPFGQFRGQTLSQILATKPSYVQWLGREAQSSELRAAAVAAYETQKARVNAARKDTRKANADAAAASLAAHNAKQAEQMAAAMGRLSAIISEGGVGAPGCFVDVYGSTRRIDAITSPVEAFGTYCRVAYNYSLMSFNIAQKVWEVEFSSSAHMIEYLDKAERAVSEWATPVYFASAPRYIRVVSQHMSPTSEYDNFYHIAGVIFDTEAGYAIGGFSETTIRAFCGVGPNDGQTNKYILSDGVEHTVWPLSIPLQSR